MGLEEVKNEILRKAEQEGAAIINDGKKEAEKVMREAEEKAAEYRKKSEDDAANVIEALQKREEAAAEFEVRKKLLDKKKEIVVKAMEDAKKSIINMGEKKKEAAIKKLVAKAMKEIPVKRVYVNKADKKFIAKIGGIECREKDIIGGIVAETYDGKINVDYSYEEILESIKDKSLQAISSLLFKKK